MELIIFVLLLGLAMWSIGCMRAIGIWGCCIAVLVSGTVLGHPFFHLSVITLDRLMLVATCGWYVWQRQIGSVSAKPLSKVDWAFLAFLAVLFISTFAHGALSEASKGFARLLFFVILPAAIYWIVRDCGLTTVHLRWLFALMGSFGIYLSLTAIAEKSEWYWAVFPSYISDPAITEFLGRARGPVLNPSGNGVLLTLGLSSWLMLLPHLTRFGKLACLACVPLFLLGIYCTLTRCVWMGSVLALAWILWCTMPPRLRMPAILAIGILVTGVIGTQWERLVAFKRDKNVSTADMAQSATLRPILAVVAWKMFQDYPLMGCGYGRYLEVAPDYLQDRDVDLPLSKGRPYVQHNIILSVLTENGLVGCLLYIYLLCTWSWTAWQLWRRSDHALETRQMGLLFMATMLAMFTNGMFQDLSIMPMMNAYLFFLAGSVQSLALAPRFSMNAARWLPSYQPSLTTSASSSSTL